MHDTEILDIFGITAKNIPNTKPYYLFYRQKVLNSNFGKPVIAYATKFPSKVSEKAKTEYESCLTEQERVSQKGIKFVNLKNNLLNFPSQGVNIWLINGCIRKERLYEFQNMGSLVISKTDIFKDIKHDILFEFYRLLHCPDIKRMVLRIKGEFLPGTILDDNLTPANIKPFADLCIQQFSFKSIKPPNSIQLDIRIYNQIRENYTKEKYVYIPRLSKVEYLFKLLSKTVEISVKII